MPEPSNSLERRLERLALPDCPECDNPIGKVVIRTERELYVQCLACSHLWSVPKPHAKSAAGHATYGR